MDEPQLTKEQLLADGGIDLDNLPTSPHVWVKRGDVMSCEGAMHPPHRHYLVSK